MARALEQMESAEASFAINLDDWLRCPLHHLRHLSWCSRMLRGRAWPDDGAVGGFP